MWGEDESDILSLEIEISERGGLKIFVGRLLLEQEGIFSFAIQGNLIPI